MKKIIEMIYQKCIIWNKDRDVLIKEIEIAIENAYDKGYNDGANAAATDILD